MEAIQRLRDRLSGLERGFLDGARYPEGLERDAWDAHAIHFAAVGESGEVLATVRLVLDSAQGLPLGESAALAVRALRALSGSRVSEISRLILAPAVRRHSALARELLLGLFRGLYEECRSLGTEYILASMEGALWRLLGRLGFPFAAVGPVAHMGLVVPCAARLEAMEPGYRRIASDLGDRAVIRLVRFQRVRGGCPTHGPGSGRPGVPPTRGPAPAGGPCQVSSPGETKQLVGGDRVVQ